MKILTLVGSNRAGKSTSASFLTYIEQQLVPMGTGISRHYSMEMFRHKDKLDTFLGELQQMTTRDLFIVCAPNYVDALPAPMVKVFEEVLGTLGEKSLSTRVLAIFHSGYPEVQQRRTGLEIIRCFAEKMGMQWCGGLSFGGTSPIDGQPLENAGPFAKKIRPVLDGVVRKISDNEIVETENLVLEDVSAIPVPARMAVLMMNIMTGIKAKKENQNLLVKPYKEGGN